jgi:hypothetical protein
MAKNDVVLLDGIIDERLAEGLPSQERDEVFEYFVLEELLKDYDLSRDEIESGWIDGRNDGGIDGVYIFINGLLIEDARDFSWPKSHAAIDVWLVTCKHHPTFVQSTLDNVVATIQELFDLSLKDDNLKGSYSQELLDFRALFSAVYRKLSIGRPVLSFKVVYGSRGDASDVGDSVAARSRQIEGILTNLFSSMNVEFRFVGSSELIESHRKSRLFSLDLPFLEHLATGKDSYVLLVRLEDYWKFVSDENGTLRRYLFDSNVRDYLGVNQVNDDIARSLSDPTAPDFWWLNNGVTILATNATVPGKTIQLQNIQIVNGLQTTETIFRHFSAGKDESKERALLVKIIVSSDAQDRDRIIRATNNQSPVEIAALHATDKIQRDIEDILARHDWYYERRRNYYRNIGKPQARFITPIYVASAVVSLVFKNPAAATRMKSRFMRTQAGYEAVFSDKLPINLWPILASIYKQVDAGLSKVSSQHKGGERFISTWRPLISFLVIARRTGTFNYTTAQLQSVGSSPLTDSEVTEALRLIREVLGGNIRVVRLSAAHVKACCEEAVKRYGLSGREVVGRRQVPVGVPSSPGLSSSDVEEFLDQVDSLLPQQPWKPGVHVQVASIIGCKPKDVSEAITELMSRGRRNMQRDGVVYDSEENVIAIDPERVPGGVVETDISVSSET